MSDHELKVVEFQPKPKPQAETNKAVIEMLEGLLQKAREGTMAGIAVAFIMEDHSVGLRYMGNTTILAGLTSHMLHGMNAHWWQS